MQLHHSIPSFCKMQKNDADAESPIMQRTNRPLTEFRSRCWESQPELSAVPIGFHDPIICTNLHLSHYHFYPSFYPAKPCTSLYSTAVTPNSIASQEYTRITERASAISIIRFHSSYSLPILYFCNYLTLPQRPSHYLQPSCSHYCPLHQ